MSGNNKGVSDSQVQLGIPLKKGSAIIKVLAGDGRGIFGVIKLIFTDTNVAVDEKVPEPYDTNVSELDITETEVQVEEVLK